MSGDYVAELAAFCTEWLKQNAGCDLIDHGFGPGHGGELTTTKLRAALDELEQLRTEDGRLAGELLRTMGERDAHRKRQIEAERVLIVLLAREGGSTEFTPAEQAAADYRGSFVSSRDVATGNERLRFVTASKPAPAPQQREGGDDA